MGAPLSLLAICITGAFRAGNLTFGNFDWAIPGFASANKFVVYGSLEDEAFVRQLNPVASTLAKYDRPAPAVPPELFQLTADKSAKLLLQWQDWSLCWRSVEAYEARTGVAHAWYMRLRPDIVFMRPLPEPGTLAPADLLVPLKDGWDGVNDRVAFGRRLTLAAYLTLFDGYMAPLRETAKFFAKKYGRVVQGTAEVTLKHHLARSGVRIRKSSDVQICRVTGANGQLHMRGLDYHWQALCRAPSVTETAGTRVLRSPAGVRRRRP